MELGLGRRKLLTSTVQWRHYLSSASSVERAVRQLNVSADSCAELLKIHIAVSKL